MVNKPHLIVIGGGAAGFFCAVNAARLCPHLQVTIVEKTNKLLSKVKVSGGGRCNVTHACFSIADMVKKYPRGNNFLKKAFHHFFTTDTIQWFNDRGVPLKTEADGRMFPTTNTSQTIIDCLLKEANKYHIQIMLSTDVVDIQKINSNWQLHTATGNSLQAQFLCIATGGTPKIMQGSSLAALGHSVASPVPSLFTFNIPNHTITQLMGVSVSNAVVKIEGEKIEQQGPLLITHWGMSGPSVLKSSAFGALILAQKNYDFTIIVNWLPSFNETTLRHKVLSLRLQMATTKVKNKNPFLLPTRLWEYLLQQSTVPDEVTWADMPAKAQNLLIKNLCSQPFAVKGKTTFKEEFVTAGGVHTDDIDANTMQSKKQKGLFFAGEVVNVDGVTGGFNFQNAWTTGWLAANGIAAQV